MKNGLYLVGSMVKFVVLLMPITTHFFFAVAFDLLGHNKAKRLFFFIQKIGNTLHIVVCIAWYVRLSTDKHAYIFVQCTLSALPSHERHYQKCLFCDPNNKNNNNKKVPQTMCIVNNIIYFCVFNFQLAFQLKDTIFFPSNCRITSVLSVRFS